MPMTKVPFNGQLNSNEIFSAIYNMIISQQVFADNIKEGFGLVNKFKVDGTLYGDTKLFYSTDILETHAWGNYSEAANLLAVDKPAAPKCQAICLDVFRQIRLTVDNYLSKRAWGDEGAFGNFQSVMLGWIGKTKEVYDNTLINSYVGTLETSNSQNSGLVNAVKVVLAAITSSSKIEDYAKRGLLIGEAIADLLVDLKKYNRKFNGYGFYRNYAPEDFMIVWNSKYKNEIRKVDLPTVFHNDGIVTKLDDEMLPADYFGTVITSSNISTYAASTATTGKPFAGSAAPYTYTPGSANANGKVCAAKELDVTVGGTAYHLFPGDELPANTKVNTSATTGTLAYGDFYIVDEKVICKLVHKEAIKYMSAFQVATEFWNPRSLTENHYLTFGYGLDYLREFPVIKVYESAS